MPSVLPAASTQRRPMALQHSAIALCTLVLAACGGGESITTTPTVPGAPVIGSAIAGDAKATISFAAPASSGNSAITQYTATCTAGTSASAVSGAASPLTVVGMANGTPYQCAVTATNSVGPSDPSASVAVTPVATVVDGGGGGTTTGTAGVLCGISGNAFNPSASVQLVATYDWTCGATTRTLSGNGVPNHTVGTFPNANNPNRIASVNATAAYTLTPSLAANASTPTGGGIGYALNSVKFDPATAGTCDSSGACSLTGNTSAWNIEALGQSHFRFGVDTNNAHVQPSGEYHYHGMPEAYIALLGKGTSAMTLVGWAADGFPIYARYGYRVATDASSGVKAITSSYRTKAAPGANRPATTLYAMGTFSQDWEYVAGLGDLDECNGRTGVTPEFPQSIYHYLVTDSYPYIPRCLKGTPAVTARP